jgi:hypothetical protein
MMKNRHLRFGGHNLFSSMQDQSGGNVDRH